MSPGWPVTLTHGSIGVRPLRRRDARTWARLRADNAGWLGPWEATLPKEAGPAATSYVGMIGTLRRRARMGQTMPFAVTWDDEVVGMLRANVQVDRMGRSSIIRVGYEAPSPALAQRIAEAYGADADAGRAIARISGSAARPIVGREALREAMTTPRARPARVPTANALAPIPPGSIPGGADFDPTTTGSTKAALGGNPSSPWVVQIAAMPDRGRAVEMLAEAKKRGGSALIQAEAFTEQVGSGAGALHRARFAGFQSKNDATKACAALKKQSYNCYAVAN